MFYDEEAQKRQERLNQVLSIPVTDFELSVRSRNCLQKMGVRTLGDLTRISEMELLSSKNFGETSLVEIRDMLHSKGLRSGHVRRSSGLSRRFRSTCPICRRTSRRCWSVRFRI